MDFRRQMNDFFAQIYRQNELYDIWAKQNRMKPSTVAVLYLLDQFETCTQGWISKIYLLPKQTIHTVVQELEQAGYLEKVSVSGRKEKPLRLTESGKRYTADKLGGLYRAEERAAAAMGAEQFAMMVEMTSLQALAVCHLVLNKPVFMLYWQMSMTMKLQPHTEKITLKQKWWSVISRR